MGDGRKNVLVIGAGMAGLTAAYTLMQAGIEVTVVEARDRSGGRVCTLRGKLGAGAHVEAGALMINANHARTRSYAQLTKLDLEDIPIAGPPLLHLRGTHIRNANDPNAPWPVELTDEERRGGLGWMMEHYEDRVKGSIGDPRSPTWPDAAAARYDRMSYAEYLRRGGASEGAIEILRLSPASSESDGYEVGSALMWLREMAINDANQKTQYFVKGTEALSTALERQLGGRVRLSSPVTGLYPSTDGVTVRGTNEKGAWEDTFGHVICTIPFSVLRSLELKIPLSTGKRRAIDCLQYTSVTRIWVQTKSNRWSTAMPDMTFTDLPIMFAVTASRYRDVGGGDLIELYVSGRYARALQAMPADERKRQILESLETLCPGVAADFDLHVEHSWDDDEWARGAYAWYHPGDLTELYPHSWPAEGNVHFAGDHTSALPGWIEGAIESGERAAREVIDAQA